MVHIRQKNYKISISVAVVLSVAFEKNVGLFFIFLGVLDTQEVQWYTKIMYVSSTSPLPKTKPKFPFRYIVVKWCISIIISRIFTVRKLSSSMQWCKEKGLSVGYCEGLHLVKNQFVTAKWCM